MSADEKVAKDLVETLRDGKDGYAAAADKLSSSNRPEWASVMRRFSEQRAEYAQEIIALGHAYGDDVDESGSLAGTAHRTWLKLKDAVTGDDPDAVLGAAGSGEDHAVKEYERALQEDLSDGFRAVVERQMQGVVAARDEVRALQSAG